MRIAIIGPAGSGKTTLANLLGGFVHISCDKEVDYIYQCGQSDNQIMECISKMCPRCISFRFPDSSFRGLRGHDDRVNVDKKVLGSFLLKNDKARHRLEDAVFEEISKEIERNESQFNPCNIIVDGLLPRFLKKIKFDYVLYVHTDKKERIKRLKGRGVSSKRIKEIMGVQEEMFRSPIIEATKQKPKKKSYQKGFSNMGYNPANCDLAPPGYPALVRASLCVGVK